MSCAEVGVRHLNQPIASSLAGQLNATLPVAMVLPVDFEVMVYEKSLLPDCTKSPSLYVPNSF